MPPSAVNKIEPVNHVLPCTGFCVCVCVCVVKFSLNEVSQDHRMSITSPPETLVMREHIGIAICYRYVFSAKVTDFNMCSYTKN